MCNYAADLPLVAGEYLLAFPSAPVDLLRDSDFCGVINYFPPFGTSEVVEGVVAPKAINVIKLKTLRLKKKEGESVRTGTYVGTDKHH